MGAVSTTNDGQRHGGAATTKKSTGAPRWAPPFNYLRKYTRARRAEPLIFADVHPLGRHDFSSPTRKAGGRIYSTTTFPPPAPSNNYKKFEAQHFFDAHGRRADQIQDHLAPPPTYKIPPVTSNNINLLPPRTATDRRSRNPAPLTMMSRPTKPIASDKDVKPTVYRPTASDGGIIFPRVENAEFKKKGGRGIEGSISRYHYQGWARSSWGRSVRYCGDNIACKGVMIRVCYRIGDAR